MVLKKALAVMVLGLAWLFVPCAAARAVALPELSTEDVAAAVRAASDPGLASTLGRFFDHAPGKPAGGAAPEITVGTTAVPVYELAREFVAGVPGAGVGRLGYQAVSARASDGRSATVWIVRAKGGWKLGNIASGDREHALSAALPAGTKLLRESQSDAWYAVSGDEVKVLRAGRGAFAPGSVHSLEEYQRVVSERYGKAAPEPVEEAGPDSALMAGGVALVAFGGGYLLVRRKKGRAAPQ
ncbi:hypothetical protein [Amycolatopsis japonica]|uniref:hypothetical protein n=1 Tax=Amycolatopsis japonica TaxID=208439 RepID=UPI00379311DB